MLTQAEENQRPSAVLLWGLITAMVVFWTLNPVVGKIALKGIPSPLLVALRTTIAGVCLVPAFFFWKGARQKIERRDWPKLLGLGVGCQVGNQLVFITGLSYTTVAHMAFIFGMAPIAVLSLASLVGQERWSRKRLIGMTMALAGVALLSQDSGGGAEPSLVGDLLAVFALSLFASFTVFGKELRKRYGPVTINAIAYGGGAIAFQPVVWGSFSDFDWAAVPGECWAALAYMAIFPAIIGYLIYYWALGYVEASRMAAMQYLQPPLATGLSLVLLGEGVTTILLVAGAIILVGVFLSERPDRARA